MLCALRRVGLFNGSTISTSGGNLVSDLTQSPITADTMDMAAMSFLDPSDAILQFKALSNHQLFSQSNLVSDDQLGHLNAQIQDPNLINPWGVAFSPKSPFWVNNNHTGTATIYNVDPTTDATKAASLVVTIAPPAGTDITASPTGIVFNSDPNGFILNGNPARSSWTPKTAPSRRGTAERQCRGDRRGRRRLQDRGRRRDGKRNSHDIKVSGSRS